MKHNIFNITKTIILLLVLLSLPTYIYCIKIISYNDDIQLMKESISLICKLRIYQKEHGDLPGKLKQIAKINDTFLHYERLNNQEFTLTLHDGFDPTATYKSTEKKWSQWREVPFPLKEELVKFDCPI